MTRKSVEFARDLRHKATDAEDLFWYRVRSRRLRGYKFKRQIPVGRFIVDFICTEAKLVVELDGGQHAESAGDKVRDGELKANGYRVLRFWNTDVLKSIDTVLELVERELRKGRPSP